MIYSIRDTLAKTGLIRNRRQKLLDDLNALDLFGKALRNSRGHASRSAQLKRQHSDRLPEWESVEPEIEFHALDPNSTEGQSLVAGLDADTLHEIATHLVWDDTVQWFLAIARHPACDHATLWAMYHLASPSFYEAKAREAGNMRPDLKGMDGEVVDLLDLIVDRFTRNDIASRRFAYIDDYPAGNVRLEQRRARDEGRPLFWELPETAYAKTLGQEHEPALEVIHGDAAKISFARWLAAA